MTLVALSIAHVCSESCAGVRAAAGAPPALQQRLFAHLLLQGELQREQALVRYTKTVAGKPPPSLCCRLQLPRLSGKMLLERDKKNKELQAQVQPPPTIYSSTRVQPLMSSAPFHPQIAALECALQLRNTKLS
jgi:hypothetical protein